MEIFFFNCAETSFGQIFSKLFRPVTSTCENKMLSTPHLFLKQFLSKYWNKTKKKKIPNFIWPKNYLPRENTLTEDDTSPKALYRCGVDAVRSSQLALARELQSKNGQVMPPRSNSRQYLIDVRVLSWTRQVREVFTQWRNQFNGPGMANGTPHDDDDGDGDGRCWLLSLHDLSIGFFSGSTWCKCCTCWEGFQQQCRFFWVFSEFRQIQLKCVICCRNLANWNYQSLELKLNILYFYILNFWSFFC